MTFTFTDAVVPENVGKQKEPNPFEDIIQSIAMKTRKVKGKDAPVAKEFIIDFDGSAEAVKTRAKILRQLGDAGALVEPQCTVRRHAEAVHDDKGKIVPGKNKITFWTIERMEKKRTSGGGSLATNTDETPADTPAETPAAE